MSYIGSTPTTQSFIAGTDYFNGDGSTTAFTLSRRVVSVNDIEVVINNVEQQPNTAYTVSGTTITFTSAPSAGTANIYVRYLSTTTQSITPSQGTVSYSTLNSDNQSKLGISFKNRIINGAMVVNQRAAGTVTVNQYFNYITDRWCAFANVNGKYTSGQSTTAPAGFVNSLVATSTSAYTVGAAEVFNMGQYIEGYNIADLGWGTSAAKTVTLSFWVQSSLTGTFGGAIRNSAEDRSYPFTYTISAANTWQQISITVPGDTTGTWLTTNGVGIRVIFGLGVGTGYSGPAGAWAGANYYSATGATSLVGTNGATFYITGVQLEVGTQATTFDYRSYGTELSLCQRYYKKLTANGVTTNAIVGYGAQTTTTTADIYSAITTSMRSTPTVTFTGLIVSDSVTFDSAVSAIVIYGTGEAVYLGATYSAAGAQYRPVNMRGASTSSTAYLAYSAEL